jgi:hypothetical protein
MLLLIFSQYPTLQGLTRCTKEPGTIPFNPLYDLNPYGIRTYGGIYYPLYRGGKGDAGDRKTYQFANLFGVC